MKVLELLRPSTQKVRLQRGTIELYTSIHELPCSLFSEFQCYLIQDLGIGSTLEDLNTRFQTLDSLLSAGKIQEAISERYNQHIGLFLALEKFTPSHLSFGCLVYSVNGEEVKDHSEDGLKRLVKRLSGMGLTNELVKDYLNDVKKNLIES